MLTNTRPLCITDEPQKDARRRHPAALSTASEIALNHLSRQDCILIKTRNSAYSFLVAANGGVKPLITSLIIRLVYTKAKITDPDQSPTYVSGDRGPRPEVSSARGQRREC